MAIYHFHAKLISRSRNESSLAASAYNTASRFTDRAKNKVFNYQRKKGVIFSEILAPPNVPDWVKNREELWNTVEQAEKRRDAQVARAIIVALPKNLSLLQQKTLLREFLQKIFVDEGMIVDFSIHHDNQNNPHAHILLTTRKLERGLFTQKVRKWNTPDVLVKWRESWSKAVNQYLQDADLNERVDHRSYLAQGIKQKPTQHLGKANFYAHKFRKAEYDRYLNNVKVRRVNGFLKTENNTVDLIGRFGMRGQGIVPLTPIEVKDVEQEALTFRKL